MGSLHHPLKRIEHQFFTMVSNGVVGIDASLKGINNIVKGAQFNIVLSTDHRLLELHPATHCS